MEQELVITDETKTVTIRTTNPYFKKRILGYRNRMSVHILSKKEDAEFVAKIPISYLRIIEPKQPWQDIMGCLEEGELPDFSKIEARIASQSDRLSDREPYYESKRSRREAI